MTTTEPKPSAELDGAGLRERYRIERDKRLRADGNDQYIDVTGDFARFVDDPYAEPVEREPLFDEVTAIFIGGGFGGLVTGARLAEAGIQVRIIEKGGDFGGTWYWNRYPGAQCDTHSFVYMPLLEETGHVPTEKYAHGPEILEHSRRIGEQFGLYDDAVFQTEVTDLRWDDDAGRWIVRTNRGDEMRAQFVLMCTGPLHRPKLPGIPGIESFGGHAFHTSRWDYDYTGGDPQGALHDRSGRQARRDHRHRRDLGAVHPPPGPRRGSSSSSSNARRARSTCATTPPPTWTGSRTRCSNRAGRTAGSGTSPPTSPRGRSRRRTWSATGGPI